MRESSIERRLALEVTLRGGLSLKIMPVVAGAPDRLVVLPGGRLWLVETKATGGRLRPVQVEWHRRAALIGTTVVVLTSTKEVVDWLDSVGEV